MSVSSGALLMGTPLPVMWLWFCMIGLQVVGCWLLVVGCWLLVLGCLAVSFADFKFQVMNDHCGYHFPFHFSPEFHDFHHLK
jgi:hypothetical protein